jgi:tRNA pseudouridine55 synthase
MKLRRQNPMANNQDFGRLMRQSGMYDGILLVDKPSGPTSHDIVDSVRKKFGFRKVGHGGTLDPQATGLLVLLIEKGTKLSNLFLTSDKAYEGVMRLGVSTDTQDAQGEIVREADPTGITREQLDAEIKKLTGDMMQTPPMVSAIKKNGVSLYKLARKGKVVERKPRLIHVFKFNLTSFDLPLASFELDCTKGTYVRTLCSDIGDELGCGASLDKLRRTRSGELHVKDALSMDTILEMDKDELLQHIVPLHKFVGRAAHKAAADRNSQDNPIADK